MAFEDLPGWAQGVVYTVTLLVGVAVAVWGHIKGLRKPPRPDAKLEWIGGALAERHMSERLVVATERVADSLEKIARSRARADEEGRIDAIIRQKLRDLEREESRRRSS